MSLFALLFLYCHLATFNVHVFYSQIDVLRIYSNYVNNFPKAIGVINKSSRGSQKFRKFLQVRQPKNMSKKIVLPLFDVYVFHCICNIYPVFCF